MARYIVYEVQKMGSEGPQVSAIQEALPRWTCQDYMVVDGVYGSRTEAAVKIFQTTSGLPSDGVVGRVTGSALDVWRDIEKGFDVSHWNTVIWDDVPFEYRFCNIKSTEGLTYTDPNFVSNVAQAEHAGLSVGAYHYTKFANDPHLECAAFLSATHPFRIQRLYLDLEHRTSGLSSEAIWEWTDLFMRVLSGTRPHCRAGIYTSRNYLSEVGLQKYKGLSAYDLWAADWGGQPYVYPWNHWDTWQYTAKGDVDWAEGDIDLNYRVV